MLYQLFQHSHPNIAHLFGLTRSLYSPGLVFFNDLIPARLLWENGSAIVRCYIAHRIRKDIDSHESDHCFLSVFNSIIGGTWNATFLQPDTGLFCISPIHSFQDAGYRPSIGRIDPKEPALSPLPAASYDDSYVLSHYLNWPRGGISPELAFQKDISFRNPSYSVFDHNPKQTVSLAVITSTVPATPPTIIGKFKNLQYRVLDEELSHPSSIQNTQDMFKTTDKEMEITIWMGKWVGGEFVGQKNEPSSGTVLKGWTRISYDKFWSYSTQKCYHCDHKWMWNFSAAVYIDQSSQDWLSATWLSQAQYFCDAVNGLYKDIPGSAALLSNVCFHFLPRYKNHYSLLHPNFGKIFLFIAPITASHLSGTSGIDVCWGNDGNDLFHWSFNPEGSCPLSKRVAETLGLPELIPNASISTQGFADYQYEATKQFQLFRGYNPSTQEFAQRHGLPLVDIIWPDGKTGPDEDGDSWYDCQETQDKNGNGLYGTPFPDPSWFPAPKEFVEGLLDTWCSECGQQSELSVTPWLHGFLPDYELDTWQGHLFPIASYIFKRDYFSWSRCPDDDKVKAGRSISSRNRRNSF
ncbi:hypothetical protein K435DRAFT_412235 [Dendrothele bispora CBS 962.96]|uniref:Uncharacterized protein n=1 Tax=Dendrothele bispora (strain CBS 962.96) TaxID=1314807 RepID=A0A4S8L7K5_DENBC|nr:hypothetical protein K435DRAFT_412235 [Dendrothele bispora CBS 962.96]